MNESLQPDEDLVRDFAQSGRHAQGPESNTIIISAMKEMDHLAHYLKYVVGERNAIIESLKSDLYPQELPEITKKLEQAESKLTQMKNFSSKVELGDGNSCYEWEFECKKEQSRPADGSHNADYYLVVAQLMQESLIRTLQDKINDMKKEIRLAAEQSILEQRINAYVKVVQAVTGVDLSVSS